MDCTATGRTFATISWRPAGSCRRRRSVCPTPNPRPRSRRKDDPSGWPVVVARGDPVEAVTVSVARLPALLLDELHGRLHDREGTHELQCWLAASPAWLAGDDGAGVSAGGWGARRGVARGLPAARLLSLESVERGRLSELHPVEVRILADWARAGGAWWRVGREWFRGRGGEPEPPGGA